MIKAWASMKSFRPKATGTPPDDDPGGPPGPDSPVEDHAEQPPSETAPMPRPDRPSRNAELDCRGEERSNATHASGTDPDARLCKTSPGPGAMLCFMGHGLMETRTGLIVRADRTRADGQAQRRAALSMIHAHSSGSTRQLTPGADRGYDSAEFVRAPRQACVTPHVAQESRHSAIDGRTTRQDAGNGLQALRVFIGADVCTDVGGRILDLHLRIDQPIGEQVQRLACGRGQVGQFAGHDRAPDIVDAPGKDSPERAGMRAHGVRDPGLLADEAFPGLARRGRLIRP